MDNFSLDSKKKKKASFPNQQALSHPFQIVFVLSNKEYDTGYRLRGRFHKPFDFLSYNSILYTIILSSYVLKEEHIVEVLKKIFLLDIVVSR